MGSQPSVLLVGHDASRSGAPTAALAWLRWVRRNDAAEVAVVLAASGPLAEEFRRQAPTRVLGPRLGHLAAGGWSGSLPDALAWPAERVAAALARTSHPTSRTPVVVANTAAAWPLAATIRRRRRLVLWLHELDHTVDRIVPTARQQLLDQTDHIVAVGPAVAEMVTQRWRVSPTMVSEVPSSIDAPDGARSQPRGSHDLVAVGSLSARKAPDVFVALAARLARDGGPRRAAWVGGPLDGPLATMVRRDVAEAGLTASVDLPGEVADVASWLPRRGVLVHVAREDPAPLAVLEAALRGVPVVCWARSGAASLAEAAGRTDLTVAHGDVAAMAECVARLLDAPSERDRAGRDLAAAASTRTTGVVAPQLHAALLGATP